MRLSPAVALAALGLGLAPPAARADLAPPVPPARDVKFTVELDDKAKGPKLIVPSGFTRAQFRPRGPVQPPGQAVPPGKDGGQVGYLEVEGDDPAPADRNPNHLMVAGVALSLALGLGGVWLVRRQGASGTRGLALLLAAGGTLVVSTAVWANAPPPPRLPREKVVLPVAFEGQVNLEVTVGGDAIRLILDKETFEKMKKDPKPAK